MKTRSLVAALAVAVSTAAAMLAAPVHAPASTLDRYLDAPRSNEQAEYVGGVNPEFSTDPAVLGGLLDEARSSGIPAQRYAALLHQYWLTVATTKAGLDLNRWDPQLGLAANEQNMSDTFAYYQALALEHPDFLWTGQGGMAGPSFAAGMMDVDLGRLVLEVREARDLVAGIVGTLDEAAAPATAHLPSDVQALLEVGALITAEDIAHFQVQVVAMSKHIFMDLIPQHEAYLAGGMTAIDEYHRAGLIDDNAYTAWKLIATGDPENIVVGNQDLLYREQFQSIGDQWDRVAAYGSDEGRGAVGRALTYLSTIGADPAIPGVVPPREASPLTLTTDDIGVPAGSPTWHLQTPLPDFNWADRESRWEYITERMVPQYRSLKENQPDVWRAAMSKPMSQQMFEQRAFVRLPQVLSSVAATTALWYG